MTKEEIAAYKKEWYKANKTRIADLRKSYCQANKVEIAKKKKAYNQANKVKIAARTKLYQQSNPEIFRRAKQKRRAIKRQAFGTISKGITEKLMALQRGKCAVCKASVKDKHHLDHIMPLSLGGTNEDSNIQILCPSCNCSKGAKHPQDFMNSRGFIL